MKLKVFIGFVILALCFIFGGLNITEVMSRVVAKLQYIISLQEMQSKQKMLLNQIKEIQTDLLLKDSPHAASFDTFVQHGETIAVTIDTCSRCHHPEPIAAEIVGLRSLVEAYQGKLSRIYTLRANTKRFFEAKDNAFGTGEELQLIIGEIFLGTDKKITEKTEQTQQAIAFTRLLLIVLVTVGPAVVLLVAGFVFIRFSKGADILSRAFSKIREGDLEYRISAKMDDEFRYLAEDFNNMGVSLKEQCRRVESMQQRYRKLFESAGDAIFILEAEGEEAGKIISANKAAADMHGYSSDELVGLHIRDLDDPDAAAEISGRIRRMLGGEWINEVVKHQKKDGTVFPVEISAGLLEYDGHKHVLAFDRDISQRVKADEALQRARQLALVGEMAAGLVHEIKNPLAGIKVSIEILAQELVLNQEDKEVFLRVILEVNRIETLLKNLLSYARPPKPHFGYVDLNLLLENSVKNAQVVLKSPNYSSEIKKEVRFLTELSPDLPKISADASQLQQIFLNLFLNGIEAICESGTITVKSGQDQAGNIQIFIQDTGNGFDDESLQKAFQPFYTTKPKGNGLGLAITKRLIEQHRGNIQIVSRKGEGSTFAITLPVEQHYEVSKQ